MKTTDKAGTTFERRTTEQVLEWAKRNGNDSRTTLVLGASSRGRRLRFFAPPANCDATVKECCFAMADPFRSKNTFGIQLRKRISLFKTSRPSHLHLDHRLEGHDAS